ncbi:MAG: methyltransferase domain-containing protein [Deltaproteobacteria bacterium]|nr:methyltransferase domain-containing protein [Deltaproteobacteria bacterium]
MPGPRERIWNWFEYPHRLRAVEHALKRPGAVLLDVGCGNHSPSITKRHFPEVTYHGIDQENWNRDERDAEAIDRFFSVNIEDAEALASVEDGAYDALICSHVLEHLVDPVAAAAALVAKLKPSGVAYFEVPSRASLDLPKAEHGWMGVKGCLNFWDDPTHTEFVDIRDVAARLRQEGCTVTGPFPRRMKRRLALLPVYAATGIVLRGYVPASVLWDATGFAEGILVTPPSA